MKNLSKQLTKIFQVRNYNILKKKKKLEITTAPIKKKRFDFIKKIEKAENNTGFTYIFFLSKNNSYPV